MQWFFKIFEGHPSKYSKACPISCNSGSWLIQPNDVYCRIKHCNRHL